jgi:hypothetical protein
VTGVIRIKAAPSSNGNGAKPPAAEKVRTEVPAADNGAEPHRDAAAST